MMIYGGNPLFVGVAIGFAGGSVYGGFNAESIEGIVVGGLFGAALGMIISTIMWGASWIGTVLQPTYGHMLTSLFGSFVTIGPPLIQGVEVWAREGNLDIIYGMAGGMIGAFLGSALGNFIMIRDIYKNINTSARVRDDVCEAQERIAGRRPNFDIVKYKSDPNLGPWTYGEHHHIRYTQ